jgi:hypothetical protein
MICSLAASNQIHAQEIGYNLGLNKLGINANSFQPVYGFSIGYQLNKVFGVETNLLYSLEIPVILTPCRRSKLTPQK